jgi:ATP-dependent helicase/nuclease subunit B
MVEQGQLFLPFSDKDQEHLLFCGMSFPQLEKLLLEHVHDCKKKLPLKPVIIVVPSGISASCLRKKMNCGGFRLMNLKKLALHIAGGEMWEKEMPAFGEHLLASDVMKNTIFKDNTLYPFLDSPGFLQVFLSVLKDFRQGGIDPGADFEILTRTIGETKEEDENSRFLTVLKTLKEYRNEFRKKYFDVEDLLEKASFHANKYENIFGTDQLFIYGFYHLDSAQGNFISKLSRYLKINSYLPVLPGNHVSEKSLDFYRNLNFKIHNTEALPFPGETGLSRVRQSLLVNTSPGEPTENDGTIRILSCPTQTDEVREISRIILKFAGDGIPFDEMGIFLKNPGSYGFIFHENFTSLGIPFYYHDGLPVVTTPVGKTVKLFLNLVGRGFPRFEVMEFISSGNISFEKILGKKIAFSPALWDHITRKAGIQKGIDQWKVQLIKLKNRKQKELEKCEYDEEETIRSYLHEVESLIVIIDKLNSDLESFASASTWESYVRQLEKLIRLYVDGSDMDIDALVSSLENLKELDLVRSPVAFDVFRTYALEKIRTASAETGRFGKGCVNIFTMASGIGLSFSCVFIPGMSAKDLPGRRMDNPLVYDREKDLVNSAFRGRVHVISSWELQEQESLLFSMVVRSSRERLVLSYSRTEPDSSGEVVPSPYLLEVGKVMAGKNVFYNGLKDIPGFEALPPRFYRILPEQDSLDRGEYRESILRKGKMEGNRDFVMDLAAIVKPFHRILSGWENRNLKDIFTSHEGRISGEELLAWTKDRCRQIFSLASVTKLEEYHTCPYKFFLKRILGVQPIESPEDVRTISSKDRGDLYHRILHEFFTRLKNENSLPLSLEKMDYYSEILETVMETICEEAVSSGITGDYSSWYEQSIDLKDDLRQFLKLESSLAQDQKKHYRCRYVPSLFEHAFGFRNEDGTYPVPPAEIKLDAEDVFSYLGKIDRVDFSEDNTSCLIIDYKTGRHDSKRNRSNSLIGGKQLQLPLYLYSASQVLEGINDLSDCGAILYFITKKGEFREVEFTGEELKKKRQDVIRLIRGVLDGVNNGVFIPFPKHLLPGLRDDDREQEVGHCGICDYKSICPDDVESISAGRNWTLSSVSSRS